MVTLTEDNDEFYGTVEGGETVFALGGDDYIDIGQDLTSGYTLIGGTGNDQITAYSEGNFLFGDEDNDWLEAYASHNELHGGAGNDYFYFESSSFSSVFGDDGNDEAIFNFINDNNVIQMGAGADHVVLHGKYNHVEGGDGDDGLEVYEGHNTLLGGAGNDTLSTNYGDNTLIGGTGDDTYYVDSDTDTLVEEANGGFDRIYSSYDIVMTANFEAISGAGAWRGVSFTGNDEDNIIDGSSFADMLMGGAGNDTFFGGTGNAADTMYGGAGNDEFFAGYGSDHIEGGDGDDLYIVIDYDYIVEFDNGGIDTIRFVNFQNASLADKANIENLVATTPDYAFASMTLTGNSLGNLIVDDSEGSADTVSGLGGNDTLRNTAGADAMSGGDGDDTILIEVGGGNGSNANGDAGNDTLHDFSLVGHNTMNGGAGDDLLIAETTTSAFLGGDGNDTFRALAASTLNTFTGGLGDDIYEIAAGSDATIVELADEGTDTLRTASATFNLADVANIENLTGTSSATGQTLTGNSADNVVTGSDFADTLDGGGGADTLAGGAGDDTYTFNGLETLVEAANGGTDSVISSVDVVLGDNIENITLVGTATAATGNALANVLTGNSLANVLTGGAGNDTYIVIDLDQLVEAAGGGTDLVRSSVSFTLAANFENLVLTGAALTGKGNAVANIITGNAAANKVYGLSGGDTISAGSGNDWLDGGTGRDVMTGGSGKDIFDFNFVLETGKTATTRDVIRDFTHLSDDINLATIDASTRSAGNNAFRFIGTANYHKVAGEVRYARYDAAGTTSDKTLIAGDINGDGLSDFQIELTGLKTLTAADFVL
jgi:Ca2+-binding RTX toxin-like protein